MATSAPAANVTRSGGACPRCRYDVIFDDRAPHASPTRTSRRSSRSHACRTMPRTTSPIPRHESSHRWRKLKLGLGRRYEREADGGAEEQGARVGHRPECIPYSGIRAPVVSSISSDAHVSHGQHRPLGGHDRGDRHGLHQAPAAPTTSAAGGPRTGLSAFRASTSSPEQASRRTVEE